MAKLNFYFTSAIIQTINKIIMYSIFQGGTSLRIKLEALKSCSRSRPPSDNFTIILVSYIVFEIEKSTKPACSQAGKVF